MKSSLILSAMLAAMLGVSSVCAAETAPAAKTTKKAAPAKARRAKPKSLEDHIKEERVEKQRPACDVI